MAMNRFMHPRNPYKTPPDFKQLALEYPEFREKAVQNLSGHVRLDFRNQGSVWALTKSLLHRDFKLKVDIIPDRLVPTLPLRLNYLLWLEDLLNINPGENKKVLGVDIGTGACCIYPLLAWKHFSWRMLATETDEKNYECAKRNVESNELQELITVKLVSSDTFLIGALDVDKTYSFCMCNPPFHKDNSGPKSRHPDRHGPRNAPTGTKVEISVHGGEEAFVSKIIDDSALLKTKIKIYTVMLGHKSSVAPLKKKAVEAGATDVASSVFCQGRTTRWGFAWTFDTNLKISSLKSPFELEKKQQKANQPFTYDFLQDDGYTYEQIVSRLIQLLEKLEIKCVKEEDDDGIYVLGIDAPKNSWINSRKRRREEQRRAAELQTRLENGSLPGAESYVEPNDLVKEPTIKTESADGLDSIPPKKVKSELDSAVKEDASVDSFKNENNPETAESYLKALITILELDDAVKLEILYLAGSGGRDSCNQLLVYLKSHVKDM